MRDTRRLRTQNGVSHRSRKDERAWWRRALGHPGLEFLPPRALHGRLVFRAYIAHIYTFMKAISLYVDEPIYRQLKALAKAREQPVAELVREAMSDYMANLQSGESLLDVKPHASGKLRKTWKRHELVDEMRGR